MACSNCQLPPQTASASVNYANVSIAALLIGGAIVGIYYLTKAE